MTAGKSEPPEFDTSVAHQARMYDYLLGGLCWLPGQSIHLER